MRDRQGPRGSAGGTTLAAAAAAASTAAAAAGRGGPAGCGALARSARLPRSVRFDARGRRGAAGLGAALAVALAGCAGSSPAIRYHALAVVPAASSAGPSVAPATGPGPIPYAGPPIVVRSVQMPPGTDRVEMARDLAPGRFVVRDFDQWAAPLGSLVRQTLVEDLAARLGLRALVVPGGEWPAPRVEVSVDVLSYRVGDGTAVLSLGWSLRPVGSPSAAARPAPGEARDALRLETPTTGDDASALADAWSTLTGQLADRIAARLAATGAP